MKVHFLVLIFLYTKIANAQSTSTLMGARSAGLGFASSTIGDEWSLFNNIGGLSKVNQPNASFAYEAKPALIGGNRMAAAISSPTKIGSWGLGIFRFGDEVYNEHVASVGFGNKIGNTSLGAKFNYIQYNADGFGVTTAISVDFGGITTITKQVSIGAYITNLTQSRLNSFDGEHLPAKLVAGIGLRPSEKIFLTTEIEKDLEYHATWRSGIEYSVYKRIFFRTAFNLNPNAAYFGVGGQKRNFKFDYAIRFSQLIGTAHQTSAVYLIPSKNRK
jgi:hypothetical protein